MVLIKELKDSGLFKRLTDTALKNSVEQAAAKSAALLATVVRDMPLYTLHNERHVLNVIGWMESLVGGQDGIQNLSELECAFAVLAAYVHDLGMTLNAAERTELEKDEAYNRHRDRFTEEVAQIVRLRSQGNHHLANLIENHIITDYVRVTHAGEVNRRLATRIHEIAPGFEFGSVPLGFQLELLALSHNHDVDWLRSQCELRKLPWHTSIAGNRLNLPFLGILLRLADIMDFDSSRTPTILFRHLGLDQPLADRFSIISEGEWKKHLAITDTPISPGGNSVSYRAGACPDPVTHKSIIHFVDAIKNELASCQLELRQTVTALPEDIARLKVCISDAEPEITPAFRDGHPAYQYHDWSFRLDQDEIIKLLMGETLYGDPNLCIRELLQNSLDALELRDLRLQLKEKGGRQFQDVDGVHTKPGFFKHHGPEQELSAALSWGESGGVQFLKVEDNGTGMALQTIERYFTQIGKSFYKSADFRAEKAEFRRHGLISTPISQFGIGILSCFMIADRISVRTKPGGGQPGTDLEISGPGSLFWTKPGTRQYQGTEVTLWLRSTHHLPKDHDQAKVFDQLRLAFGYPHGEVSPNEQGRDPGFIAARHVVWPKYPIQIKPPGKRSWTIDDSFHHEQLAPIDSKAFQEKAEEWDRSIPGAAEPRWALFDWQDVKRSNSTGTRLRIWYPTQPNSHFAPWELQTMIEPQVKQRLPLMLAQSMFVSEARHMLGCLPCVAEPACRVWIDLRGEAAPQLTADRKTARSQDQEIALQALYSVASEPSEAAKLPPIANWRDPLHDAIRAVSPTRGDWPRIASSLEFSSQAFLMSLERDQDLDIARDPARARALARDFTLARDLALALAGARDLASARALTRALDRARALTLALARASDLARDLASDLARDLDLALDLARDLDLHLALALALARADLATLQFNFLQEGFYPELRRSWPPLGFQGLNGRIGDAILTSPVDFRFELADRDVVFADRTGEWPAELVKFGYDLCFPMSAIPLGNLRRSFPKWREDRRYRPIGVLPFLEIGLSKKTWTKHAETLLHIFSPIESLYALQPAESLWFKPFADWTREDWNHPGHRSTLWDIKSGNITGVKGISKRPSPARGGKRKAASTKS